MDLTKLKAAREAFLAADYNNASLMYEELSKQDTENPYLAINTGTAFYKAKHFGKAIKYFYTAKEIIPRDKILSQNLMVLTDEMQLKQPYLFSIQFISLFESLFLLLVFNVLLLLKARFKPWIQLLIWVCFFGSLISSGVLLYEKFCKHYGVITQISSPVYSGDNESYTQIFELLDGQIFQIEREDQDWSQIEHEGQLGWIKGNNYERI